MTKPGLSTLATEKLTPDLDEWEQPNATDTLWAMSEGQPILLARYLADVALAVEGVATYLANESAPSSVTKAGEKSDVEWEGTLADFQDALAHEQHELVAIYLNDASKVIRQVATAIQKPSRNWHLQFTRKGSGRRYDPMERLARQG